MDKITINSKRGNNRERICFYVFYLYLYIHVFIYIYVYIFNRDRITLNPSIREMICCTESVMQNKLNMLEKLEEYLSNHIKDFTLSYSKNDINGSEINLLGLVLNFIYVLSVNTVRNVSTKSVSNKRNLKMKNKIDILNSIRNLFIMINKSSESNTARDVSTELLRTRHSIERTKFLRKISNTIILLIQEFSNQEFSLLKERSVRKEFSHLESRDIRVICNCIASIINDLYYHLQSVPTILPTGDIHSNVSTDLNVPNLNNTIDNYLTGIGNGDIEGAGGKNINVSLNKDITVKKR
jgi:hypothetical protein